MIFNGCLSSGELWLGLVCFSGRPLFAGISFLLTIEKSLVNSSASKESHIFVWLTALLHKLKRKHVLWAAAIANF